MKIHESEGFKCARKIRVLWRSLLVEIASWYQWYEWYETYTRGISVSGMVEPTSLMMSIPNYQTTREFPGGGSSL